MKAKHKHNWDPKADDKSVSIIRCTICGKISIKHKNMFKKVAKGCFGRKYE